MALFTIVVLVASASTPATDLEQADALFKQARALIKAGRHAEACPLLEQSHRLDPALGTLLNLADCAENTGQLRSAFLRFNEAEAWAERNRESGRAAIARQRAGALQQRLAWVAITATSPVPNLAVKVNDVEIDLGLTASSVPVDPGTVVVAATAPDHQPWSTALVAQAGKTHPIEVPALSPTPNDDLRRPPEIAFGSLEPSPVAAPVSEVHAPAGVGRQTVGPARRAAGVAVGVAGAVVAVAGVSGLAWSLDTYGRFQKQQPGGAQALNPTVTREQFDTLRWVYPSSWIATGVGLAAVTTGLVLTLTGRSPPTAPQLSFITGGGMTGLVVSGSY